MTIGTSNDTQEYGDPGRTDAPDALADNSDTVPSVRTDLTQSPPENCLSSDLPAAAGLVGIPTLCPVCNSDCYPAGSFESKTVPPGKTLCAMVEYAGGLNFDGSLEGYLHSDAGDCLCGRTHSAVERTTDQKPNSLNLLVALIRKHCTLFHDQQNRAFGSFTVNGHLETWPVGSPEFKDWAARRLYLDHGQFVGDLALKDAMSFARGQARYEGQERAVHIRVAYHGDSIYYDLCDDDWQQVEISRTGWRVIPTSESPVRFRRFRNSRPQVMPVDSDTSEAIRLLRKYVHVAESDLPLVLAWLVTAFVPEIPHPILEMQGDMGSGKSKAQIFLARLIDPSVADALTLPSNVALLEQHFSQQHALVYDNVSRINDQVSDMLCKAVTGAATIRRKLYSDDEEVIMEFQPVLLINGIGGLAQRPDLVQRTITIRMVAIPKEDRRPEDMLFADFDADRPLILGALFSILACAMAVRQAMPRSEYSRMADFEGWADSAGICMGCGQGTIAALYGANRAQQDAEVLEEDIVATVVRAFLEKNPNGFVGTSSELKAALQECGMDAAILNANSAGNPAFGQGWPRDAKGLSEHLNRIKLNLKAEGIEYQSDPNARPRTKSLRWSEPRSE